MLAIDWAQAHQIACDLEHATSSEVTLALDEFLGFPERCPHGNVIPRHGKPLPLEGPRLAQLQVGSKAIVENIRPENQDVLAALAQHGLYPGLSFELVEIEILDGPRRLDTEAGSITVGRGLAEHIHVKVLA
jgi:DtxR family Mn-dependent transcriptional regulator